MKLSELKKVLSDNSAASLHIMLPTFEFVPDHFHITEVSQVSKKFVDCGGVKRSSDGMVLQVWTATDTDHRLRADKLSKILNMAETALQLDDLSVEIEYEGVVISQYPLTSVEVTPGGLLFHTDPKHTDCLAKDKCGVAGCC